MKCECTYCVYWQEGLCILDHISVNDRGYCDDCIFVSVDENVLNQQRQKLLAEFQARYAAWQKAGLVLPDEIR